MNLSILGTFIEWGENWSKIWAWNQHLRPLPLTSLMDRSKSLGRRLFPSLSCASSLPHPDPFWLCGFGLIAQPLGHLMQCKPGAPGGHLCAAHTTVLNVLLSFARLVTATCKLQLQLASPQGPQVSRLAKRPVLGCA